MKKRFSEAVSVRTKGILSVLILLLYLSINVLNATTYYSRATGNWNTNTTWSLTSGGAAVGAGIYPIAGDIVYIQNNRTVTVNAAAACADVNIATGSALTINGFNFTSSGTTTLSGNLTHTSTTATKTFNNVVISGGTWTNNASESYTIANLTLSGSTINGTGTGVFNISGALNVTSGTNTMNALTMTVGGTTTVQGTLVFASTTGNKTFGNVVLSGGTWTSNAAETYPVTNLTLSGGTINGSTTGTFTVSGNLTVTAGSVNNLYAFNLTVNGTTTVDGSAVFLSATGTKTFVGLTTVSSTGTWDNDNVVEPINFRGGLTNNGIFYAGTSVYTFNTNNQSINGTLTIPNLTVSGVTVTNNGNLTVSTALSGSGGQTTLTNAATGTLNIGGTSAITTLTATAVGNTVNYYGAAQTVKATTYNNLTLSGSGTKTNTGTTVTGMFSIEGTAAPSTAPTWSGTAYTLQYKTTDAHTAGTEWVSPFAGSGGVIIANTAGSVTMNSAEVMGTSIPLTINSGATLATGNFQLTLGGNYINNGGTLTAGSSPIVITGTAIQNIAGFTTTGAVSSTKTGGTATFGGNISGSGLTINGTGGTLNTGSGLLHTFTGDVILTAGTLDGATSTINTAGNWTNNGGTFTPSTSTVNFTGNNTAINGTAASQTFNNIIVTKTAGQTLSVGGSTSSLTANGTFTETSGNFNAPTTMSVTGDLTLTAGTFTTGTTLNASGNWINNGVTFTAGSGTVNLNGSAQTISGTNTFNNLTIGGTGLKTFSTTPTVNGILSMEGTGTVSGAPTYGSAATLQYNTTTARTAGSEWITPFIATGGVIIANTGTITLNNSKVINTPLTLNLGGKLNTDATNNYGVTLGGNFTDGNWSAILQTYMGSGSFTANASTITISGTGTQGIDGITTTGSLTCDKTGGVATLTGTVNAGSLANTGLGGTLNLGSGLTHTISGTWIRTNGTVNGGSSTLNIGGNVTNTAGIFTASTGTVNYTGAAQTIADVNYYNLTFAGSAAKTMGTNTTTIGGNLTLSGTASATAVAGLTIGADLTIGSGTTFTSGSFTHNIGGNFTNNGTFTSGTSTINLNGTTQSISGATTFNNLTLAGNGTKTFANNTITSANFSIASGAVANLGTGLTHTASNLYLGGTQQSSSTWGGTGSVADNINTTYFAASTGILSNLKNWTGSTNTDWNVATNWSDGRIPTSTDNVIIPNVTNKPTIGAAASCKNITINASSSVSITGTNTLTIAGNWTNNGTFTANNSTVLFTGATQTISGTNTFNNLTAGGTGLKTFSTTPTVNGILSMEGTGTVSAAPTYGTAATLQYNTTTARSAGSEWISPFTATGGVIIAGTGAVSLNSSEVINAPLTINSGSTLNTTSANNYALTFGRNFTNSGTFTANASAITITGTTAQSIAGFSTTGAVTSTKTGGTATLSGNVSAGSLTINGAGGTLNLGTSLSHTITGDILITTGILDAGSSIITTSGNWTNNTWSSFTPGSSTVYMTGTAKAIGGIAPTTFNNLTISSGSTTLNGNGNIAGNLTINSSATLTNSSTYTLSVTGTTTISGTYTDGSTGAKSFTGDITINSAGVWNETNSAAYNIAGSLTNNGTSFTANTGNHTFSGSSNFFSGSTISSIPYLTLSGSYTNNGTLTVGTTFGGTGNLINNGTLNIGGTAWTVNITASAIGNTINYTGSSAQTIRGITYYNLGLSGVGTKTFPSAISINNNISLASGTTVDLGSNLVHTANVLNLNGVAQSSSSFGGTGSLASTINPTYFVANTGVLSTANNWTGATSTDWNTATNWSKGTVPTASDAAFVPNVTNKPIINSSAVCSSLTVFTGSGVTINGSNTLTVSGNIVNAGTVTSNSGTISLTGTFTNTGTFNSNTGTVNYNGAAQTVAGVNYYHLALSGSGAKTLQSGTTTIGGNLTLSGTVSTTTVAVLSISGNLSIGDGTTLNAAGYNLTVTGTTTVGGGTSGILNITGINTKTFNGDVILSSGSTWNESAASDVSFGGSLNNNASTFTISTGNHTFSGSSNLFSGSSITSIPYLTLSGSYSNNGTLTVGTTFGGTGNIINNGTLNIGGTAWSINLTASSIGNTVNYTGSSAQTIRGTTYYNLGLSGGGTKTFPSSISINNNISLASGTAADLGSNLVHTANVLNLNGIAQSSSTYGGTGSIATTINTTYFAANTGILSTANNWTGATNTDWGTTTNWSKGTVPTIYDAVFIPNVTNKPVIGAAANCNNITINASSSVSITGTNTLTIAGNWTNNGTFTANNSTVLFTGATQTISGTNTFNNLTAGGTGLKTFSTTPTVNGILSMEGTGTVSAAPTYGTAATLQYNTTTARSVGPEWISPFTATGGVIIASTGAVSLNSSEVINAPLTINSGSTLNTTSANNYALTFGGNFTNNGTFTANASAITITGTTTQSIAGFTTTGGVSCDKTAGVATLTGNVNAGSLANTGLGGTLYLGVGLTHTISGAWTRTAGTVDGGSSTLNIGGSVTNTAGTFTASTSTVNYTGASQTIANTNYYNLTLSGSGTKTLSATTTTIGGSLLLSGTALATIAANLSIAGNLNIGTGTSLDLASFTANRATTGGTLTIGGTLLLNASNFPSNYSTVSTSGSSVNYNGAAQTVYATNYNNLTLSGSGVKTLQAGTTAISGSLLLSGTVSSTAVAGLTIGADLNIGAGT
ncbi:MAG: hypothetical protein WCK78_13495, partial [Paludibacter sp.]